jgi:cytochrome c
MIPAARAAPTPELPMYVFESTTRALAASLVIGSAVLAATPFGAAAQAPAPASNAASYTTAQAERGQMVFDQTCARCHSNDLTGGEGPPLLGQPLLYNWGGQPIAGLIRFVQANMPMSAPGTLDAESAVDVVAYVLSRNRVAAGNTPLALTSRGVLTIPPPRDKR